MHLFGRVRELSAKGYSLSAVSRELGIHRSTVQRYLKSNTPPKYQTREKSTRVDKFKAFEVRVRTLLEINKNNRATDILEILREEGYTGSDRTLFRRMAAIFGEKHKERFFKQEYTPGEQAQFDFKEKVTLPFCDGPKIIHLHVGSLPYSGLSLMRAYPGRNFECFIDGCHSFFEKIGGMTKNMRFDNLSPCVSKVGRGNSRVYTEAFSRAAKYYDIGLLPCAPGKGSDKGDVERDIRTWTPKIINAVKNNNICFRDFAHLNEWLDSYFEKRTSDSIKEKFAEEKKYLKPCPAREEGVLCKVDLAMATAFGTVRIGDTTYSVDDSCIGSMCRIVVGPYETHILRMLDNRNNRKTPIIHPRKGDKECSILLEHCIGSLVRKPQAMLRWAHQNILFPLPVFKQLYNALKIQDPLGAEREFLKTLNLIQHTRLTEIATACELVLEAGRSVSLFDDIQILLFGQRKPEVRCLLLNQVSVRPTLINYDSLIPKNKPQGDSL